MVSATQTVGRIIISPRTADIVTMCVRYKDCSPVTIRRPRWSLTLNP